MEATIPPPLQHVCHRFRDLRKGANKVTVKISEIKEDLDVTMTRWFGLFLYGPDSLQLHPDAVRCNYETYEANVLHSKLAFG